MNIFIDSDNSFVYDSYSQRCDNDTIVSKYHYFNDRLYYYTYITKQEYLYNEFLLIGKRRFPGHMSRDEMLSLLGYDSF